MQNPFESGQIKNYLLLYASVVVIMVLFFIATTLFNEDKEVKQKEFNTEPVAKKEKNVTVEKKVKPKFQLLEKAY
ncbi:MULTISPECIES: hypothetical protein [Sulfurimonas]|uniref:hypothetical protein n=1 Tax=Sulfurimonas TaxID=202746 RepID=UPI001264AAAF|nr:hypothetical protein [Sulfurimonas indica]